MPPPNAMSYIKVSYMWLPSLAQLLDQTSFPLRKTLLLLHLTGVAFNRETTTANRVGGGGNPGDALTEQIIVNSVKKEGERKSWYIGEVEILEKKLS